MQGKIKQKGLFAVKVYLTEPEISAMAKEAEKLGLRRKGIPIKIAKPHGFAEEWHANTDGISRYLKLAHGFYLEHEAERLKAAADLAERKRQIAAEEARLSTSMLLSRAFKQPPEGGGVG